jgi:pimeloyl-ACP methyl ester carboxylesterase
MHQRTRLFQRIGLILAALFMLVGVLFAIGQVARRAAEARAQMPGRMINLNGQAFHLLCQGPVVIGQPTIVLEAGLGETSLTWAGIQPSLAATHRVCAYDRPGYGWSAASTQPPTAAGTADTLARLLAAAGEPRPYVLVAHSLGGVYARVFAQRYPEAIAGLVLLDPSHEEMVSRLPADWQAQIQAAEAAAAQELHLPAQLADLGVSALFPQFAPADPRLPAAAQELVRALGGADGQGLRTLAQEIGASARMLVEVQAMRVHDLGDLPLVVVKAGTSAPSAPPEGLSPFTPTYDLHAELAAQSTRGRLITLAESSHYVHYDEPEQVIRIIGDLVRGFSSGPQ